jgi:hypothetical protein
MSIFLKSAVVGLGLVAGIATAAPAQTVSGAAPGTSIASLPPSVPMEGPRASSYNHVPGPATQAVVPSGTYPGPTPGTGWYPRTEQQTQAVLPSPQYIGPRPN